ncbi:MAG: hypothetical protein U0804_03355 [Gemmataceae bacterium]
MRLRWAGLGLAVALAVLAAAATRAQDDRTGRAYHWPHRKFFIPIDPANVERAAKDKGTPVPAAVQLYYSLAKGPWQAGPKRPLNGLDTNSVDGKKGFDFTADRDGEFEFSVQNHYADGSSAPAKADELSTQLRVVIDSTLPAVRVNVIGNGVEWTATDDNLDPEGVRLQAKFPNWPEWKTIDGRQFRAQDQYAWKLQPGQVLDVRVLARDRAGNESFSAPVQVPGTGAFNTAFPRPTTGGSDAPIPGAGSGLPQPRIDYVKSPNFDIDYRIEKAGRSGIEAAELYVQKPRSTQWQKTERYPLTKTAYTGDNLKLKYTAPENEEGMYGFYVAPESGAGKTAPPPGTSAPPMVYVTYDKTPPYLQLTGVRVGAGGAKGPLVEVMWETFDQNLLPDPISLSYALTKDAVQWTEMRYRLPPGSPRQDAQGTQRHVGQFTWEVPDEKLWKFYVRAQCVDKAGNSTTHVYKDAVVVDLETPAASITGVRGSGEAAPVTPRPMPQPEPQPRPPPKADPPMTPALPEAPTTIPPTGGTIPTVPPTRPPAVPELPVPPG